MKKIIFLSALKDEFFSEELISHPIFYTGVGKINASYWTTKLINDFRPKLIVNIGTAGSVNPGLLGRVVKISSVVERDMMCFPLAERGGVPFDDSPTEINLDNEGVKIATGDSFVTQFDPWLIENNIDLVDMELFAIAKVCLKEDVKCSSIKFVSDLANHNAENDWREALTQSTVKLKEALSNILGEIQLD